MKRRTVLLGASAGASAAALSLVGDLLLSRRDAAVVPVTIGILSGGLREDYLEAFRQGLRANGWIPGANVVIVHGDVGPEIGRLTAVADELVAAGVRLIVATGPSSTSAVMKAHPSMPVVMVGGADPVAAGFVPSLAEPGGNVTGIGLTPLDPKRVEVLKAIVPTAERLAFITNLGIDGQQARLERLLSAAGTLGLRVGVFDVRTSAGIEPALADAAGWKAQLLLPASVNPMANATAQVVGLAARYRIPACYSSLDWVRAGGLLGIGPDVRANYRRAAHYVDRILRGALPGQLPIEGEARFEMLVHRRALADLGLTLPNSVVLQVNEWVD